jgi:hypothetical protein
MFLEKNLSCGIVGGYGPVEIATGGDAFPVSRCEMISMVIAGKELGFGSSQPRGFSLVGANHEAHYSVKRPGLDIFRLAPRSFVH